VEFNKKAAGFEAKVYQTGRNTPMFVIPLVSWIGFIGVMFSFGIIWFIMGRFIDRETHLVNAAQQAADNLNTITSRFEDEQKRSIDLQHRLIDMSKQTTRMETRLDEYARATSQLESLVKYLRTSLTEGEGRVKSLEKELSDAVQRCKDAEVKASSLEAIIDAAGRTEESLRSSLQSLMDQKDEQHLQLSDKIRELTRQLMALAGSSDVTSSLDEDKASSKIEMQDGSNELTLESLAKLQADLIQERTKFQSEFAVIEWTNTKLRNELDELKLELAATKSALTEQEREFRESKLTLEETILSDKRRELDDVTTRYEAEIKFLRDQLRAANDRYADKSA
jgi:predicted  nucleic acid-binding Zn-ribbon protein